MKGSPDEYRDPVVEAYKKDIDRTLIRENLKLTVEGRFRKAAQRFAEELRRAGREAARRNDVRVCPHCGASLGDSAAGGR